MSEPVRVIVVDDNPRIRSAWERLINRQPDMVMGQVLCSGHELAAHTPQGDAVVLVDLSMPGPDPLGVVAEWRDRFPGYRVIVYSGYNDANTVQDAMAAGAWGLVDKVRPPLEILDSLRRVARSESVFPDSAFVDSKRNNPTSAD